MPPSNFTSESGRRRGRGADDSPCHVLQETPQIVAVQICVQIPRLLQRQGRKRILLFRFKGLAIKLQNNNFKKNSKSETKANKGHA